MTTAKCTENGDNAPEFDFTIFSGASGETPSIVFELPVDCRPDDYAGPGVFEFSVECLLADTVKSHLRFDEGRGTFKLVALLREYADRLEGSATDNRYKWTDDEVQSC